MTAHIRNILIVEDEASLASVMSTMLSKDDVHVTVAYNGQEALEVLEKRVPDVLILDILMPVLDGHGVMKAMKEKNVDCPVIVVSNLSDQMTKEKCKHMHIVKEYFVKSDVDDDDLWKAIQKYLFLPTPKTQ